MKFLSTRCPVASWWLKMLFGFQSARMYLRMSCQRLFVTEFKIIPSDLVRQLLIRCFDDNWQHLFVQDAPRAKVGRLCKEYKWERKARNVSQKLARASTCWQREDDLRLSWTTSRKLTHYPNDPSKSSIKFKNTELRFVATVATGGRVKFVQTV